MGPDRLVSIRSVLSPYRQAEHRPHKRCPMDHNDVKIWSVSTLLNILAFINPQVMLITLGIISTCITIAHNAFKFYRDVKGKKTES